MGGSLKLPTLSYAVLALGDRSYDNFCGFGRDIDKWLAGTGARPMVTRIDVNNGDPAALAQSRAHWRTKATDKDSEMIEGRTAATDGATSEASVFAPWQLMSRVLS